MKLHLLIAFSLIHLLASAQLTNEKIWFSRDLSPKGISGLKNLNDGQSFCKLVSNDDEAKSWSCQKFDIKNGQFLSIIFSTAKILIEDKPIKIESYDFSENEKKAIITNGFEAVYRHSGKSNAYVLNLENNQVFKIGKEKVMYPTFSPDGNKVAYVIDNNLYYFDLVKNKEVRVTKDGLKNEIINGAVDWVYEEEFSMSRGFEWSPSSQFIAFYRFDETQVPEFSMDIFGSLYPKKEIWKYPKAGEKNSVVDVYIHKIGSKKNVRCETGSENDQYLPRIKWISDNYLTVQRLNRHQNKLELLEFSYQYPKPTLLYEETNEKYIEINDFTFDVFANKVGVYSSVFYLSEKSGFNHLYLRKKSSEIGAKESKTEDIQITTGDWEIDAFLGIDKTRQLAYFTSGMDKPSDRHLYAVNLVSKEIKQITKESGWHNIQFTETFDYFIDRFSTMMTPTQTMIKDNNGELIRVLEDNKALTQKLETMNLSQVNFGSFTSSENIKLDYWEIRPPNFDETKKYPVLFFVYGGPGYQTVKNQWGGPNYLWYQMMAQKGYIVVSIDNRGSGGRGEAFKKCTYLQLGKYETQDYIEAAKHWGKQPFIEASRIGIFGWSYGGFMASNAITFGAETFKAAVAVAPVTNWRYYDNIYTERYMRTPQENPTGYDLNSPINFVDNIKGNYLIIHGTADDNVHFQNAAEMVKAMNEKNIPYDAEYYPNTNHGIAGGKIRWHLFNKITQYLETNL
jgi:dipeptidyl-peptidase 4